MSEPGRDAEGGRRVLLAGVTLGSRDREQRTDPRLGEGRAMEWLRRVELLPGTPGMWPLVLPADLKGKR